MSSQDSSNKQLFYIMTVTKEPTEEVAGYSNLSESGKFYKNLKFIRIGVALNPAEHLKALRDHFKWTTERRLKETGVHHVYHCAIAASFNSYEESSFLPERFRVAATDLKIAMRIRLSKESIPNHIHSGSSNRIKSLREEGGTQIMYEASERVVRLICNCHESGGSINGVMKFLRDEPCDNSSFPSEWLPLAISKDKLMASRVDAEREKEEKLISGLSQYFNRPINGKKFLKWRQIKKIALHK